MKKQLLSFSVLATFLFATENTTAQTLSSIENLTLSPSSYWNGATSNPTVSTHGSFSSGNVIFPNTYNGSYGGYWESGWSYSNITDNTTAGYLNQYSASTGSGYNNSSNYVVAQPASNGAVLKFNALAQGKQQDGFYITNSTFAAISMRDGDMIGKKFGGVSGNDPDWFKLKITKYLGGSLQPNDTVVVYLADFRFASSAQDYILTTWQFVDLKPLGNVDSLLFILSSSDNTGGYMNTPSYFCADNFTTLDAVATSVNILDNEDATIAIYPNPTTESITINTKKEISTIKLFNALGELLLLTREKHISVNHLPNGVYSLQVMYRDETIITEKFIKE